MKKHSYNHVIGGAFVLLLCIGTLFLTTQAKTVKYQPQNQSSLYVSHSSKLESASPERPMPWGYLPGFPARIRESIEHLSTVVLVFDAYSPPTTPTRSLRSPPTALS